jgi:hypothetical protein
MRPCSHGMHPESYGRNILTEIVNVTKPMSHNTKRKWPTQGMCPLFTIFYIRSTFCTHGTKTGMSNPYHISDISASGAYEMCKASNMYPTQSKTHANTSYMNIYPNSKPHLQASITCAFQTHSVDQDKKHCMFTGKTFYWEKPLLNNELSDLKRQVW